MRRIWSTMQHLNSIKFASPVLFPHARRTIIAAAHPPTATAQSTPQQGDVLSLHCSELTTAGGLCKVDGAFVVFVEGALPGERLLARVTHSKSSWARAVKVDSLQVHDNAVAAVCPLFGTCGGCTLQSLAYPAQLAAKHQHVAESFRRLGGFSDIDTILKPVIGSADQYGYRNKMEFSFGMNGTVARGRDGRPNKRIKAGGVPRSDGFALGLHLPKSNTAVLPVPRCDLQSDPANALLTEVEALCRSAGLQAFNPRQRVTATSSKNILQHVVIRRGGPDNGSYVVNIVTSRNARKELAAVASALAATAAPWGLTGVVNTVSMPGRAVGERAVEKEYVLWGEPHLNVSLAGLTLQVSPNSFFQVNTGQAEVLYRHVAEAAALQPSDVVLDLFCGTGSMTLMLAQHAKQAWGVDISSSAIADAERNASLNRAANARFLCGDVSALLPDLGDSVPCPDVVVLDPARSGVAPDVIEFLRQCGARRIVYVSCNPGTQARDIRALCAPVEERNGGNGLTLEGEGRYRLVGVTPVDLFPQTFHVESVAVLERVE